MAEWFPIDTAPSGEEILVSGDGKVTLALHWSGGPFYGSLEGTTSDCIGSYDLSFEPTHWMPLPEPPTDHLVVVNSGGSAG